MRRMIERARHAPRLVLSLTLMAGLVQGCGTDPTNPDDGDPPDPPANQAPVAAAGPDGAVSVGIAVALDGSGSTDADGDALTHAWVLTAPTGSAATLDDQTSVAPSFVPDVEGAYVVTLTVSDGTDDSAADEATITAADNTVTQSVPAASGGSLDSSDGALSLVVPPGALAADTEIHVTPLGSRQLPPAIAGLPGEKAAYDLGPDGTTFSSPVEISFDVDDAVTSGGGRAAMAVSFLVSESGGSLEEMSDVELAQDEADPTSATLSGGLSHFSHAIFASPSMTFTIEAPDEPRVGEAFDVTFTLDLTGLTDPTFTAFTTFLEDRSPAPVGPEPQGVFRQDFPTGTSVSVITNRYECQEAGEGEVRVALQFAAPPLGALIHLGKDVLCAAAPPALETTLIPNLYRAQRLLPVPGSGQEITTGGLVRRVNLETKSVVELSEASGDPPEWVFALSDGAYLVHSTLGSVDRLEPGAEPETNPVASFDQARHVTPVSANTVALASAFGDLGLMTYTPGGASGSFQDAFRSLDPETNPQQSPPTNLQAIWVSPDGQAFVGAVTEGDGDSAANDTRAALLEVDVPSGEISVIPLPGIIDFVLDTEVRHQFDLDCAELEGVVTSELLCAFTSGFDGPAFDSPNVDLEGDGYIAIFTVETFDQSSELLFWDVGNGYVGASVFPFDGSTTAVAAANQLTGDIDVWHVRDREVSDAFTVSLDGECAHPTDLILLGFGARGALACQATTPSAHGVLVIENLDLQLPPVS